jgi:SAM-dependent methyltransferase
MENPLDIGHIMRAGKTYQEEMGRGNIPNIDYLSPDTYKRIIDQQGNLEGKKIIEVGAGIIRIQDSPYPTGYEESLVGKKSLLIPVDVIWENVQTWNLAKVQKNVRIAPVQADGLKLPFPDESVDGCISVNLINMYPTIQNPDSHEFANKLIREIYRTLRKGGFVIISSFGYTKENKRNK